MATYTYDFENRLVTLNYQTPVDSTKRGSFQYAYDYRTRRVVRDESGVSGGVSTNLSFSGGLSVQERNGSTISRHFVRGSDYGGGIGGVLYSLINGDVPVFDHYNSRGDVIGQTDGVASVTWQTNFEDFGMGATV